VIGPPAVAIFGGCSYALFAARTLKNYLDAEILCIGTRNEPEAGVSPAGTGFPVVHAPGMNRVKSLIDTYRPDLVLGSSFEQSVTRDRGFTA
jgi:hypothetical protein